jgi:hypothetical protein
MKKLLFIFLMLGGFGSWGQTAGVTVITHGFDALAGTPESGIDDWIEHGYEVAKQYNDKHPGQLWATVYVNDGTTGLWKRDTDLRNGYGSPNSELIFVYDWTKYSNNPSYDRWLEASADHLFALLTQPATTTGNTIYSATAGNMLLDKETHFIGHSRGAVLLLQVLHRIKNHFPDVTIEHLTLLDPHPAGKMSDVKRSNVNNSPDNLPCVQGYASGCGIFFCSNGIFDSTNNPNGVRVQIPENVVKADCYYRTEGNTYEPIVSNRQAAPFSGVPVIGLDSFNRKLNNVTMSAGSSTFGGAHSGVHTWYFYSISRIGLIPINGVLFPTNCNINLPPAMETYQWFTSVTAPFLDYNVFNPTGEGCFNTGYYYSRLGNGYGSMKFDSIPQSNKITLATMNQQLNTRLGTTLNTNYPEGLINGNFTKNWKGGWFSGENFSYGTFNEISIITPNSSVSTPYTSVGYPNQKLTHNYFYCPTQSVLKVVCSTDYINNPPRLQLKIKNNLGVVIKTESIIVNNSKFQELLFNIDILGGKVGSITLEQTNGAVGSFIKIQSVDVVPCNLNTITTSPYLSDILISPVGNWSKEFVEKSTKWGIMSKFTWGGDNQNLTIGEASKSIVITANKLGIVGYDQILTNCWEAKSYIPYVNHLKLGGFLPSSVSSDDIMPLGLLCDVLNSLILQTYNYQLSRADQNTVIASNATYRNSILSLYSMVGYRRGNLGKKVGGFLIDGKYDPIIGNRKITGSENVTRAIFAKLITGAYEFKYYQTNFAVPNARIAAKARISSIFDDIAIIGSKAEFDNDVVGTPPTISIIGSTEYMRSGDSKNFAFSSDLLSDGTQVKFFWSIDGVSQGLQLSTMPQYISNNQGVTLIAPTVTTQQTYQFYIHISTVDGRTAEMFKDIIVSPNNVGGNTNLTNGEYFFDSDPGVSLATALPITLNNYGVDATVPIPITNLQQGIHTFNVRVKDSQNNWSLTHAKTFLLLGTTGTGGQNAVTQAQYFVDSLQNTGSVTVNVSPDANNQFAVPINITLSQGIHTISFRVKDDTGLWSLYHTKTFLVLGTGVTNGQNSIVKGEYFFDNNDSTANRIQENITLDANNQVIIPITINLTQGIHTVSFRVKDANGLWSLFHTKTFLVIGAGTGNGAISQVEYFIDNEPGFNNGTQIPFVSSSNQMIFDISLPNLSQGVHVLYVRVKTNQGKWSLTHAKVFVIMPNTGNTTSINRIEYFIDTPDPGQGNATSVSYVNNSEGGVTANFDIAIGQLSTGIHQITVRARDTNGNWSPVRNLGFDVLVNSCPQMYSIKSGSWNDTSTWSCGRVPTSSDNVVITATHTVNVPTGNHQVKNITQNGFLNFEQGSVILVLGGN